MGDIYTSSAAKPRLLVMLEQVSAHLQRAQNALTTLRRNFGDELRRPQEVLRARESNLQKLLASSLDAMVVTNGDRRIVEANREALNLFGVSESNLRQFTINAFISDGEILDFNRKGSPFINREERHGKCHIRRLDGSARIAEYVFVANIVPRRHLYRFPNVAPQKVAHFGVSAKSSKKPWEIDPPNKGSQQAQSGVSHLYQKVAQVNMPGVSANDRAFSWMLGGGAEYLLTPHWSARANLDFLRTHLTNQGQSGLRPVLVITYTIGSREKNMAASTRQHAGPMRDGTVHFTSSPSQGEIYIDDEVVGDTPSELRLPAGEYTVKVVVCGKEWTGIISTNRLK